MKKSSSCTFPYPFVMVTPSWHFKGYQSFVSAKSHCPIIFFNSFPPDLNKDTSYEEGKIPNSFDAEQGFTNVKIKFPTSTVFSCSKQGKILFPKATSSEPLDKAKGSEDICSLNVSDQRTETRLLDPSMDTNDIGYFYDKTESFTENEKYDICRKIWRPVATFTFPQSLIYGKKGIFLFMA